jgi:hypothetical protein
MRWGSQMAYILPVSIGSVAMGRRAEAECKFVWYAAWYRIMPMMCPIKGIRGFSKGGSRGSTVGVRIRSSRKASTQASAMVIGTVIVSRLRVVDGSKGILSPSPVVMLTKLAGTRPDVKWRAVVRKVKIDGMK